jgi:hypothetical protein
MATTTTETTAQAERREVGRLFVKAEGLRDRPGSYFPALQAAEAALKAWQAHHPAEAAREEADRLRSAAAAKRRKAQGALVYDADGWHTANEQQRRHDELEAEALELERQAEELA